MISTRRIVAAVGLAVGVTGLAAPMANADATADATRFSPISTLDSLAVSDLPEEQKRSLPRPSQQLAGLNQVHELNRLNELHQVTDLAAPALGLLGAVQ
ncbi:MULTISPECIES: hypothetical protein [Streptomyces]|jgi:hypothetical protein|uniref:Secreted protein n=1 Tax=Streptomyces stelliscabiei TaxID=146820 RepID=A0A8I0PEL0_9ACTN|nr:MULTISPECIES: hypothetical protein [Streptomyces]KND42608.1 hypothetical protein IQ64_22820 [Streptomyces stelliscabiei]MBE1602139.1 hypothetical protein [Streptomyces stelliscabiei]MDX2514348.1 hypothetical protein [Streptomyces stelliscabiei]MDX2552387.1 hypothetical protein [Streptomyces stelliscabiei]MDX2611782.1 hypothetical protein [Streptomyces stelliscabiei]